jgi:hypothetical protein
MTINQESIDNCIKRFREQHPESSITDWSIEIYGGDYSEFWVSYINLDEGEGDIFFTRDWFMRMKEE